MRSRARGAEPSAAAPALVLAAAAPVAWAATALVAAGLLVGGIAERPSNARAVAGAGARAGSPPCSSNRYEYWRVALNAFRDDPLIGAGSGGFRVVWLQERPIRETVRDTHSLEFEVAAELGLVGLLALALMCGGVVGDRARERSPAAGRVAAGAAAALVVWVAARLDRLGLGDAGRHAARRSSSPAC